MNKEFVIHGIIWAAATIALYYLWKKNRAGDTVTLPGIGTMTWDQYNQQPTAALDPWGTTGVAGSGDAGWTGAGTDSPYLPPDFTFN
jgi:hypothetical protein